MTSYQEFVSYLGDKEYFGQKLGLERIQKLFDRLGNPERQFQSIHIAGTNGKGSTAAMLASILQEEGLRVGLYTSPHLIDFCERIQVNGEKISQQGVLSFVHHIQEVEEEPLTFFEMATAIGFLYFAEKKVDLAVIETGLGGRLDATNVLTPLVSVITTIGLDHTIHLGDTLGKIASEKAGIIKPGVPVVVGPLGVEPLQVVRDIAASRRAPVIEAGFNTTIPLPEIPLAGKHQRQNARLALAVIDLLKRDGRISANEEIIKRGLAKVSWPGRLETIQQNPWILLDGAHNSQAMKVVADYLRENLKGRHLKVLMGAMADKDLRGLLNEIAPITDDFIFTAPVLKRAASPESLAALAAELGKKSTMVPNVKEAFRLAQSQLKEDDVLLVTGSLFVVGNFKRLLQ